MLYQLAGGLANIAANYYFVVWLKLGVSGVALATLISQTLAAVMVVLKLRKLPEEYRLGWKRVRADKKTLLDIIGIGIPSGIQATILTLSNLVIQSNINQLDSNSIAAFVAYFKVELFVYLPIQAIGQVSMNFVSQNVGAKEYVRTKKGIKLCILIGVLTTIGLAGLTLWKHLWAFSLFTNDRKVITIGYQVILRTFPFYFIYVFLEVFSNALRGIGRSIEPMLVTLVNMCLVRLVLVFIMMKINPTAEGIATVYPLTWLTSAICMAVFFRFRMRRVEAASGI